jgi:hypothetical protein
MSQDSRKWASTRGHRDNALILWLTTGIGAPTWRPPTPWLRHWLARRLRPRAVRTARTVLAINRDPDAFIFHWARFGIIADVRDALPQLIASLRRAKA